MFVSCPHCLCSRHRSGDNRARSLKRRNDPRCVIRWPPGQETKLVAVHAASSFLARRAVRCAVSHRRDAASGWQLTAQAGVPTFSRSRGASHRAVDCPVRFLYCRKVVSRRRLPIHRPGACDGVRGVGRPSAGAHAYWQGSAQASSRTRSSERWPERSLHSSGSRLCVWAPAQRGARMCRWS